ncbi:MAG: TIGR02757 family protein [Campylobacterota bacterium]
MHDLQKRLDAHVAKRNDPGELCLDRPDPLLVARYYKDEKIALICALFGYGSATAIVKFLRSLDFSLLQADPVAIERDLAGRYYRFQKDADIIALFRALQRIESIETIVAKGTRTHGTILGGIAALIDAIYTATPHRSRGFTFLAGKPFDPRRCTSTHKRYHMYLRWMVRNDCLDMGLWKSIQPKQLLMPLDTHTFHVSRKLGLLKRKSYDCKAVQALTQKLREFDPRDPVKYDFALYRLGQEKYTL